MESSCSSSTSHFRSISLPSRLNNPSCAKIETKINELKALGNLAVSIQTIQSGLVGLAELYVCVDELVRSPQTEQVLSRHENGMFVEDVLEGSIGLLDSCSNLKDMLMLMRENVHTLQSALRRKGGESIVSSHIAAYLCFRKKTKKNIIKSLGALKHLEKKMGSYFSLDVDNHHVSMVTKVLRQVTTLTISLFKSLLVFISAKSKPTNRVQILSKLVTKSTSTLDKTFVNEVETVDIDLMSLHKRTCNGDNKNIGTTLQRLQILDTCLEGFETGLDRLFRRLVQNRASFLNIIVC